MYSHQVILEDFPMKRSKIWMIIVVIALLVGSGYFYRASLMSLIDPTATAAAKAVAALEAQTVSIRPATDLTTVSAAGNIALDSEEAAMFEVEGVIDEVLVEVGDEVASGDLLATLKTTDLERAIERADLAVQVKKNALDKLREPATAAEVAAARAQLVSAQEKLADLKAGPKAAELAAAQAALAAAQASYADLLAGSSEAELTQAAAEFNKTAIALKDAQGAYDRIAYSDSLGQSQQALDLQQATIDYDVGKAGYEIATEAASDADVQAGIKAIKQAQSDLEGLQTTQSDLASAEADVANAQSSLATLLDGPSDAEITDARLAIDQARIDLQEAETDLSNARLRAPLDGTITTLDAQAGEKVTTDISAAIYIADLTAMELTVNVSEVDIAKVYVGQPAKIVLDAFPDQTFSGQVSRIAPTSTASSGVVNYEVAVRLDNLNLDGVKAGMTAVATIADDLTTQEWLVPTTSLQEFEGETTITVVRNGQASQITVTSGISQGEWTTVASPQLQETDKVVGEVATFVEADQANQGGFGGPPPN
jgi:HlyD family secretion protein